MEPRIKAGKAFRDFFVDDRPDRQAKLRASIEKQFSEWLTSDEYREIREQTRQRWLTAGTDIDLHPDFESRFRMLVANANPEFLRIALDRDTYENRPSSEWFRALFQSAVREQVRLNAAIPPEIPETPTAVQTRQDGDPFLGLVFNHDSTVKRLGKDYRHVPPIPLAPQPLKLLKFIHDAGKRGRTVQEIVPAIVETKRILTTEKSRFNLSEIDIDLGGTGQYVVRCTRPNAL